MNSIDFEKREPVKSPQEELARLRGLANERQLLAEKSNETISERTATKDVIESYVNTKPEQVLHEDYVLPPHEANEIVLELSPEPHDKQIEMLIDVLEDKGIRNALRIVEKMNNPHLYDDFHRFLVQFIASGYGIDSLKEGDAIWKPLHMTLFEVSLPEIEDEDKSKRLAEVISGMEQFYAGMLSIIDDVKNPAWFSLEIANANGSDEFVFYISIPSTRRALFEKHIMAIFPGARVAEHKNDYNIFNEKGCSLASYASLAKHSLYPLKPYSEFNVDPIGAVLNSFSKIDKDGEGASIQLVVGNRQESYAKEGIKALEKIRKGKKVGDALGEIGQGVGQAFLKDAMKIFKSQAKNDKEKEDEVKRAQALDQATIEQFTHKLKSPFVAVNIRIAVSAEDEVSARGILNDIESSFNQFENGYGNKIEWKKVDGHKLQELLEQFSFRNFEKNEQIILNIEEMTTMMHFPAVGMRKVAPQLKQSLSGTAKIPLEAAKEGTLIGINDYRGEKAKTFIASEDRMRHFYVIGQTGTGKTTLLRNMIVQDIREGKGVCFIDPHGSEVMSILANIPKERYEDVVYFDPAAVDRPMALNMLEYDRRFPEQKTFVVNEMFSIFQKLYGAVPESMGPIFEQYFRNATMLVIEDPDTGSTLLEVSRVMSNKSFRDLKVANCKNPVVVQFWKEIAEKAGGESSLANIVPYITSKFDVFLANEIMRPIIAQEKSSFNMREIMDGKKILLVNLSKGRLGDINSHLIGLILVGKILMAALSRVDAFGKEMNDFYLYLDEFQNITTDSIATILSEARKYRLSLNIAHQFIGQLDEKIKNSVFGNVGSMAVFRVGTEDAEFLEKQFAPTFIAKDIINLRNYNAYMKLLAHGHPLKPFNIETLAPDKGNMAQVEQLKELSSLKYGKERKIVEEEIMSKYNAIKS